MTARTPPDGDRIARIFFPNAVRRAREFREAGKRFVYYTSAETAASILRNRQVWMRLAKGMNDYMVIEHGLGCLKGAWDSQALGTPLKATLDACHAGLAKEVEEFFNAWLDVIRSGTYMTCISEHLDGEDSHGRLSMWRAYGGSAGVALVLNSAVMFNESNALAAYALPVAYLDRETFAAEFLMTAKAIEGEVEYVKSLDRDMVKRYVFDMLRAAVLSTKHPGFSEELEWRIIASPQMHPDRLPPPIVEIIRGTPQPVLKIDLVNQPEKGLTGLALPELLNKIIIGPCEFPLLVYRGLHQLLKAAEVPEPEKKITISDIPIRHLS